MQKKQKSIFGFLLLLHVGQRKPEMPIWHSKIIKLAMLHLLCGFTGHTVRKKPSITSIAAP